MSKALDKEISNLILAHTTRNAYVRAVLETRVQTELKTQKYMDEGNERKGRRRPNLSSAIVDPTDSITYAVYPIEPEIMVSI